MNRTGFLPFCYQSRKLLESPIVSPIPPNHLLPSGKQLAAVFTSESLRNLTVQRQFEPWFKVRQVIVLAQIPIVDHVSQEYISEFPGSSPMLGTTRQLIPKSVCRSIQD